MFCPTSGFHTSKTLDSNVEVKYVEVVYVHIEESYENVLYGRHESVLYVHVKYVNVVYVHMQ